MQSHAEYLTISQDHNICVVPSWLSPIDAVASLEWGHYAYQFLKYVPATKELKVLVNGASWAIWSSITQMYALWWAEVTCIAHQENKEIILGLWAKHFIDYTTQDVLEEWKKYDLILDTVGNISFLKAKSILTSAWVYGSSELWPARENVRYAFISLFSWKQKCKFPFPDNIKESMNYVLWLLEKWVYKPLIDQNAYALDEVAEAYTYVMKWHKNGSVMLTRGGV